MFKRFTLIQSDYPNHESINELLQWLGGSLGLFNLRDKDKSRFRIFIALVQAAKKQELLSSDDLAVRLQLSRGTVIHHVNHLIDAGIVEAHDKGYAMRMQNLSQLIEYMERDLHETCRRLKDVAKRIDDQLGLP